MHALPCHAASLKPAQYAQCVTPSNGESAPQLETANMQGQHWARVGMPEQQHAFGSHRCGLPFSVMALPPTTSLSVSSLPAELSSFVIDPSTDAPRQCCFTFPLGDSGVVAAICLTPTSNVTAELKNNPITKVGTC